MNFETVAVDRRASVRLWGIGLGVGVAAIFAFTLWWSLGPGRPLGQAEGAAIEVSLLAPEPGSSAGAGTRFIWAPVAGVVDYRVEILDKRGRAMLSARVLEPNWTLDRALPAEGTYRWWVRARFAGGREVISLPRDVRP